MASAGVPRNFKLLDEYDCAIGKSGKSLVTGRHIGMITYGPADEEDIYLNKWNCMIIGIQGKQTGELIYNLVAHIPKNYPQVPPVIQFRSPKIAMNCVDSKGNVNVHLIRPAFQWTQSKNIADLLMAIRDNMHDAKVNRESLALANSKYS